MIATAVVILDLLLTTTWILRLVNERVFQIPQVVLNSLVALVLSFVLKQLALVVPPLQQEVDRFTEVIYEFPELLLDYFLGFLLFATALHVDLREFRRIRVTVFALSVLSTLLSALLVGVLTYGGLASLYALSFREALLFGAIISPTDPVAVMSILKKYRRQVPDATRFAILGESLFNDAVSVILYVVLIRSGKSTEPCTYCSAVFRVLRVFLVEALGGVAIGFAFGLLACHVIGMVEDALLEVTTSVVLVLNLEVFCSYVQASVPLAAVFAGIVMSSRGRGTAFTRRGEKRLLHIWKFIDETLNGMLFLLIGLSAVVWSPTSSWKSTLLVACITILITMIARAASVVLSLAAVMLSSRCWRYWSRGRRWRLFGDAVHEPRHRRAVYRIDSVAIIIWSGLRGGVSIALALAAPGALEASGQAVTKSFNHLLFMLTYIGVVWSILVQGLFFGRILRFAYGASDSDRERSIDGYGALEETQETASLSRPETQSAQCNADLSEFPLAATLDSATYLSGLIKSAEDAPDTVPGHDTGPEDETTTETNPIMTRWMHQQQQQTEDAVVAIDDRALLLGAREL
jgi:CPA1 family monovalent cation:H+ antiporter